MLDFSKLNDEMIKTKNIAVANISILANKDTTVEFDAALDGYTPLGIVGFVYGAWYGEVTLAAVDWLSGTTWRIILGNKTASDFSSQTVNILFLYVKQLPVK